MMTSSQVTLFRFRPFWHGRPSRRARATRGYSHLFGHVERLESRSLLSSLAISPVSLNRIEEHLVAVIESATRIEESPAESRHASQIEVAENGKDSSASGTKQHHSIQIGTENSQTHDWGRGDGIAVAINTGLVVTPHWTLTINHLENARLVESIAVVMSSRFGDFDNDAGSRGSSTFSFQNRNGTSRDNPVSFLNLATKVRSDHEPTFEKPRSVANSVSVRVVLQTEKSVDQGRRDDSSINSTAATNDLSPEVTAPSTAAASLASQENPTPSQNQTVTAVTDAQGLPFDNPALDGLVLGRRTDQRFTQLAGLLDSSLMTNRVAPVAGFAPLTFTSREADLLIWHSGSIAGEQSADDAPEKTLLTDNLTVEDGPPPTIVTSDAEANQSWSAEPVPLSAGLLPIAPEPGWWAGWLSDPKVWLATALAVVSGAAFWRRKGKWRLWA